MHDTTGTATRQGKRRKVILSPTLKKMRHREGTTSEQPRRRQDKETEAATALEVWQWYFGESRGVKRGGLCRHGGTPR